MPLKVERCSSDTCVFHSERNVVQRYSYPRRNRVCVLTTQCQGRRCKLSPNLHGFWLANAPKKFVGNSEGEPFRALAAVNGPAAAWTRFLGFLAFGVQVRNRLGMGGWDNPVSLSQKASRTARSASPSKCLLSTDIGCWP